MLYSQYKAKTNIGGLFASGDDEPSTVKLVFRYSPLIGRHYFGDLLDGHQNLGQRGSYFGLSYIFYWLTKDFSYEIVFVMFVLFGIAVCGLSIKRWLRIVSDDQKNMVYALHFSYPFVFAADRGQMHLLIGYLFALGLSFVVNAQGDEKVLARGQLALAAAFSMKLFPSIAFAFFPNFWSLRRWKVLISSLIVLVLVPIFYLQQKFDFFTSAFESEEVYNLPYYFGASQSFNTSLKALIFNFQSAIFQNLFDFLFLNYFIIYLVYALVAIFFISSKSIRSHERLLVGAIVSISIAPIAAVYCQTIVAACALLSLTCDQFVSNFRRRLYVLVILISIVPFNVPLKSDPINRWRIQNAIVPLAQHAYVVTMCVVVAIGYLSSRRNSTTLDNL